jgi:hypothetical protein
MSFDQLIEQKIKEHIMIALSSHLDEIIDRIACKLSAPEHEAWGRYLSPKQAMLYTGFRSQNGFKEMCRVKGIEPIKVNQRVLRYDREELDRINIQEQVESYIESLKY